ncbi:MULTISPECIES: tautomerase family protein [unclassified Pseudomonas]|uniref:tautomerase family protein n=1 Tax=Pseudomonas sp. ADAK22 TaxID=2730851 RepID=UPI00146494FA|nr:4-oxalocrotonate tautomerase family protein [Pseudomonas sp. ADAK22]QJI11819.1 4-oxalocrotonate tautomerase family protein [Pseudomonas sp. ADAK22]
MPIVKIELFAGRSDEQKAQLAKAITQQFLERLASRPEEVIVLFQDVPPADWFVAGRSLGKPAVD